MERLTEMYGGMIVPRKACTFDRYGGADDCKECTEICEDEGGVCRTCILQECLTRLWDYEDTGLTPEQIRELKERDTAQAPEPAPLGMDGMVCPACGKKALPWDRFCGECGQRFWEDEDHARNIIPCKAER